ncbi:MAG TPA: hypothetical protein VGC96_04065 [Candidatus Elarobacter sp.]|jgi:hypothetical protein
MIQPVHITVDPTSSLGYIEYRDEAEWVRTRRLLRAPDGSVAAHRFAERRSEPTGVHVELTGDDDVVALEILSIDEPTFVAIARDYALQRGLSFPEDIRADATGSPAA